MNKTYRSIWNEVLGAWVAVPEIGGSRRKGTSRAAVGAAVLLLIGGVAQAQVKIGDNPATINPGSLLELESTNRGVSMPRVALTDRATWTLNGNQPVEGMMVYNTNATTGVNGLQAGMAVWKGGQWVSVDETPYFHVNSTAVGNSTLANSGATGANSIAVGPNATASGDASYAAGLGATASTGNSVAVGANAVASNGGLVAIGPNAQSLAQNTIAIGGTASVRLGIAIGFASNSAGNGAITIGDASSSTGAYNVALGMIAKATGDAYATALGYNANASQRSATALGVNSVASAYRATALGRQATASGESSLAAGSGATASALNSVAQGFEANASVEGGVALGSSAVSDRAIAGSQGTIPAGSSLITYNTTDRTLLGAVSVGNATSYRQITNVADGTEQQDAVTVRQLSGALQSFAVTPTMYFHANSSAADSLAVGAESVAIGPKTVVNGDNGIGMGNGATVQASAPGGIAIGQASTSGAADSVALGTQASANAVQGVALGAGSSVTQAGGVALGAGSVASTAAGVAGYIPPTATAEQRTAIGATTSTLSAVSVGDAANGQFRQITGVAAGTVDSDAVNVSQLKAVQGQVTQLDQGTVKYDTNVDGSTNYNSVTMGGSNATGPVTVHNVGEGVAGTDAVNVNQLNGATSKLNNRIDGLADQINANTRMLSGGIAASAAMAVVTPVEPGRYHVSGAVAGYNGQAGIGFNLLKRSDSGQTTLHAGVGWGSGGSKAIVRVGFGFSFD